jgi:glycerol-3-phosphate cytidylyltransferase
MIIGITFSAFDLCHAGHILMLKECKTKCDHMIVGLQTDPTIDRPFKNKPIQTIFERSTQLNGLRWVDEVITYDTELDLINMLSALPINKRFIGSEYRGKYIHGEDICNKRNIEIVYIDRMHNYSSSELRKRVLENESHK